MEKIRIQFTLFSAFYSPLISTMSGGFLKEEGLEAGRGGRAYRDSSICGASARATAERGPGAAAGAKA